MVILGIPVFCATLGIGVLIGTDNRLVLAGIATAISVGLGLTGLFFAEIYDDYQHTQELKKAFRRHDGKSDQ